MSGNRVATAHGITAVHGSRLTTQVTEGNLLVVPLRHPVLDALGHRPMSSYGEQFWLPVIGPSALWAYRRLNAGFVEHRHGYPLDLTTLSREIGLGSGTGRHSPVVRTLARLVDFDLADLLDGKRLGVRISLPPLTRRQAARLPEHLANRHRQLGVGIGRAEVAVFGGPARRVPSDTGIDQRF